MAFIREYAMMSGDPGRHRHRFRLPKGIRKLRPGRALGRIARIGGLVLGGGLALRAAPTLLRAGGGLIRGAAGFARGAASRAYGGARAIVGAGQRAESNLELVADQYGMDVDELAAMVEQAGYDPDELEGDIWEGDIGSPYGDIWEGDPAGSRRPKRPARGRQARPRVKGRGTQGGKIELLKQIAQGAQDVVSQTGIPGVLPMSPSGSRAGGRGLMLLPGHRRRCHVNYDATGHPICRKPRMNVANVHAVRRAMRRVTGFDKLATRVQKQLHHMAVKSGSGRVRHAAPRGRGRKCGCK